MNLFQFTKPAYTNQDNRLLILSIFYCFILRRFGKFLLQTNRIEGVSAYLNCLNSLN